MNYEIYDDDTLAAFREGAPDPALLAVVEGLVAKAISQGLWDSTCIVAGEPSPDLLGFDPVADPPDWAWRTEHVGGWVELGLMLDAFTWGLVVPAGSTLDGQM